MTNTDGLTFIHVTLLEHVEKNSCQAVIFLFGFRNLLQLFIQNFTNLLGVDRIVGGTFKYTKRPFLLTNSLEPCALQIKQCRLEIDRISDRSRQ